MVILTTQGSNFWLSSLYFIRENYVNPTFDGGCKKFQLIGCLFAFFRNLHISYNNSQVLIVILVEKMRSFSIILIVEY